MISARSKRTEITDILLTGENTDPDIQENVRISSCAIHVSTFCTPSLVSGAVHLHSSPLANYTFPLLLCRAQDGQLSSSLPREEMSLPPNLS